MDELKPGEVSVDLNSLEKKVEEPKMEDKYGELSSQIDKLAKTVNYLSANHRHDDKLAKRVEEIYERLNTKEAPVEKLDELDELAQRDWKKAVETVAERVAERKEKERTEKENLARTQVYLSNVLEQSKAEVMKRHPEIETDPTSEKAQIFARIVKEKPDYLTNPYGPTLAMRDMEDELRQKGHIDPDTNKFIEKEANRRLRTVKTNLSKDRATDDGKIVLDRSEQEFCKINGIAYEDYAKNKRTLSGGAEGVTVNE